LNEPVGGAPLSEMCNALFGEGAKVATDQFDQEWELAEDGVEHLLSTLRLEWPRDRRFEEAIDIADSGQLYEGTRRLDLANTRFVYGVSKRGLAIWDRAVGGGPIFEFPNTDEGRVAMHAQIEVLWAPDWEEVIAPAEE
jgi:hypothetical protein